MSYKRAPLGEWLPATSTEIGPHGDYDMVSSVINWSKQDI